MLIKIIGIGLIAVVINIILKQYKPEYCLLVNVCAGVLMFMLVVDGLKSILNMFFDMQDVTGLGVDFISPILKVVGVGYVTEFTSDLAEDCGNKSISGKIILGGKIAICVLALPIIKNLLSSILSLL